MKLEDFPSLTEMKGGISSIVGVEELVAVMQKKKDCVSINVDVFKQWSAVLSIISATENKAYLDHFVQLDGLNYLNEWLMQAQKFTDCAVEEFVNTLLTTIERLPANMEKFISCGIMITVEQLRGHKSITAKNKAKVLLDRWSNAMIGGMGFQGLGVGVEGKFQPIHTADSNVIEKDLSSAHAIGISLYKESGERAAGEESVGTESHHSILTRCSDNSQVEYNTKFIRSKQTLTASSSNSTCVDEVGDCNSVGSSLVLNSCQEKFSTGSSVCPAVELDHARTCSFHTACQGDDNMQDPAVGDVRVGSLEIEMETNKMEGYKCTSLQKETSDLSSSSTLCTSMPLEGGLVHAPQNFVYREGELSSLKNVEYQKNGPQCRMPEFLRTSKESGRAGDIQEIFVDVNLKPSMHAGSPTTINSNLLGSKSTRIAQKSVFGLEDEEVDALEVARQVAIEVEREVVGYGEHFSNYPNVLCGEATCAKSTDLADGIQDKPGLDVGKFSPSEHSSKHMSCQKNNLQLSDRIIDDQMTHEQVSESPRMMPAAKEQNLKIEKNHFCFDLNEDIYEGEIECSASPISTGTVKLSTPIVVLASKGVPGLPVSSVQFEAESGWRGYSATSAFRPVSPRRTPDNEKAPSLKQKLNFIGIDLNVTETQNDIIVDPASLRQIPVSSGHPSRESSVEVSSRKVEKPKLDLNRLGDGDVAAKPSFNYRLQLHDVDHSLSTASSSCSKQHYTRDFDLNDNPTTLTDADASSYHGKSTSKSFPTRGSPKLDDDSVIRIMGLRMPVDRKLCKSQTKQEPSLNNGMADNIIPAKPMIPYPQISPAYGYNILPGAAMPVPPTVLYGPGSIPYMVDSRGTTLIPQMMELTGMNSIPSATRQPPVLMNVAGAPLGLSGSFPTVAGLAPCETGRRNVEANFNHQLIHNGKPEEKLRRTSQPSSSLGMVLKRKEPDSRLEGHYPLEFKQMTFWK